MMEAERRKLNDALSMACKAGKVALGFDASRLLIKKGKVSLLLISAALSSRTKKQITKTAGDLQVKCKEINIDLTDFGKITGKCTGIVAIADPSFARKIDVLAL
ncbi:MAG: ribosomal L7Ae/L30e/S12e/Gadd45 family protein [Oscillospiraceae bacterium]|jgi:ribosomal protein L30E|nr:ribosomal L7Ae/L30e/S12e/Gadd45 family protein [Oscillospiraceae bacterium]